MSPNNFPAHRYPLKLDNREWNGLSVLDAVFAGNLEIEIRCSKDMVGKKVDLYVENVLTQDFFGIDAQELKAISTIVRPSSYNMEKLDWVVSNILFRSVEKELKFLEVSVREFPYFQ